MRTEWSLIDNPFESSTRGNYSKMSRLCGYTDAALHGKVSDPFYLNLYNAFHPLEQNYRAAYSIWNSQRGIKKAGTYNVAQLLKQLSNSLIGKWNVTVRNKYPKGTPRYKELFPQGVKKFHNGSREERISTVQVLVKCIGSDANLTALKTEVEAFALLLDNARTEQLGNKGSTRKKSGDVEVLRKQVAVAMMGIYGNLVVLNAGKLENIEPFFDLETLRDKRQKIFTRKLKTGQSKTLVKRTLAPDSELKLHNTGSAEIRIGLCPAKGMVCTTGVTVEAGTTLTVTAQQLGNKETDKFLTVTNTGEQEGSCVVTLI